MTNDNLKIVKPNSYEIKANQDPLGTIEVNVKKNQTSQGGLGYDVSSFKKKQR